MSDRRSTRHSLMRLRILGARCLLFPAILVGAWAVAASVQHPVDGPEVRHVGAVAPDVLMLTIQSRFYRASEYLPYVAEAGDEVIEVGKDDPNSDAWKTPIVQDGKLVHRFTLQLKRNGEVIGNLSPDRGHLFIGRGATGTQLDADAAALPSSYRIQSTTDPAYAQPTVPAAVYRKCKPNGASAERPDRVMVFPFIHYISLKLPAPLKEGASYSIAFTGVNTAAEQVTYMHEPRLTRSDAVHATQVGYCPDDPYKRAYLSIWLGTDAEGKALDVDHDRVDAFELVDAKTGKPVYRGKPVATKKKGDLDDLGTKDRDLSLSSVYRLDFSDFKTPGEFCVSVPGIGRSAPVRIASDVWEQPFRAAMHAILCQRSGIELKAPYAQWNRPRSFLEEDGVQFYQGTLGCDDGQEGPRGKNMLELLEEGKLERVHGIWGAHQDAGDWDTLDHHLGVPYRMFELYEMFPEHFSQIKLPLPEEEARSAIPSILADSVWMLDGFRRLQLPDGGVRGGYGDPWGKGGPVSWDAKCVVVYGPTAAVTYTYAACAARAARVLAPFDPERAGAYRESALRAWEWAEGKTHEAGAKIGWGDRSSKFIAGIQLFRLTGDARIRDEWRKDILFIPSHPDKLFECATAPDDLIDPAQKSKALELLSQWADSQIEYSRQNGFDIISGGGRWGLNTPWACWFSTPGTSGGINLARTASLTRKPEHVAAVVQACNYSFGANPMNLSYMAGVGWNSLQFPHKVDRRGGQLPPGQPWGYIPFGYQSFVSWWAENRINGVWNPAGTENMFPKFMEWPLEERFLDWAFDPNMNECVVDATMLTAAYNTGFLMALEATRRAQDDERKP